MSKNTCGNCPNLVISNVWLNMYTASCGATDDALIVPHKWEGDVITLWRVPSFCTNPDKEKREKPAPRKDWINIKVK